MTQGLTNPQGAPTDYAARLGDAEKLALERLVAFALDPPTGLPAQDPMVLSRALEALRRSERAGPPAPQAQGRPTDLNGQVAAQVRELIDQPGSPDQNRLTRALALLAQWRSMLVANTYVAREGAVVFGGLFRGMRYIERTSQGLLLSRLIGTYEAELHPHLVAFLNEGLDAIIDVGCAEGYYAVGLARLAPGVVVHAHDIDPNARAMCAELAERNQVAGRVIVGGEFKPSDFQAFAGRRVLVLVDAEGAEVEVLDPVAAPALAQMSIVVETHDIFRPGAEALLVSRFSATHDIVRVLPRPKAFDMPGWMQGITDLDQLLACWDYRGRPTPWLVMRPKRPGRA